MGFWFYIGVYTLSMIIIWGFFIIAKIHSLKFKNYQPKIIKTTNIITIILAIFTLIGYILIFSLSSSSNTYHIEKINSIETQKKDVNIEDIIPTDVGEDYY